MGERLYSIEEAADALRVNAITIRRLIWDKKLKAAKVGVQYRIKQSALDAILNTDEEAETETAIDIKTIERAFLSAGITASLDQKKEVAAIINTEKVLTR